MDSSKILLVSRIGATNLVEAEIDPLPLQLLDGMEPTNSFGSYDPTGKFVKNPIRYDSDMTEMLERACSVGLVLVDEAEDVREIPFSKICTDQKVIVRDKVKGLIEKMQSGGWDANRGYPIAVRFEYGDKWIIRDGNHRASAELLLGASNLKCLVIHVKDSFM